jgi:transposase-like protein
MSEAVASPVGTYKYPAETRAKALEMYQQGRKPPEIAKELGCSDASIYVWAINAGLRAKIDRKSHPLKDKPTHRKPGPKPKGSTEQIEAHQRTQAIISLFEQGVSANKIKQMLNINGSQTVTNTLRRMGYNPYANTPPNKVPHTVPEHLRPKPGEPVPTLQPSQTSLALVAQLQTSKEQELSPAEALLAQRTRQSPPATAAPSEELLALRRANRALQIERDALRAALDSISQE